MFAGGDLHDPVQSAKSRRPTVFLLPHDPIFESKLCAEPTN